MGSRTLVRPPEPVWYQQQYHDWLLSQQRIDPAMNTTDTSRGNVIEGECEEVPDVR